MHVVLPWSWPSHGSYLSQGLPAVAWILHESGLPPTGTRTYGLEATFLCYCSELPRSKASSRCRPLHGLSYPCASRGNTMDISAWLCLLLATPYLGVALSWRRLLLATVPLGRCLCLAMPLLGDASLGRRLSWATPLLGDASLGRRLSWATPLLGDASLGRRLSWATPLLGDVFLGRCLSWAMPLLGDVFLGRWLTT